eukprot:31237-Pelagococcus_subviridis.AAC.3
MPFALKLTPGEFDHAKRFNERSRAAAFVERGRRDARARPRAGRREATRPLHNSTSPTRDAPPGEITDRVASLLLLRLVLVPRRRRRGVVRFLPPTPPLAAHRR